MCELENYGIESRMTPLHYAARHGHKEAVEALLGSGAQAYLLAGRGGESAADLAREARHEDIVSLNDGSQMSGTETCDVCFARDREILLRPAAERRIKLLVEEAVANIRKLPGAGMSGDDSGLEDVFEEWANQMAFEHSVVFDLYDDAVSSTCENLVSKLGDAEIALLAAYSEEFSDYSCTEKFIGTHSLDSFAPNDAVTKWLYSALSEFSVNYAEQRGEEDEEVDEFGGEDEETEG